MTSVLKSSTCAHQAWIVDILLLDQQNTMDTKQRIQICMQRSVIQLNDITDGAHTILFIIVPDCIIHK